MEDKGIKKESETEEGLSSGEAAAFSRLWRAIDQLEAHIARHYEVTHDTTALETQMHMLNEDRSKLAAQLDQAQNRANRLEEANKIVSHRLIKAMETLRLLLESSEAGSEKQNASKLLEGEEHGGR